jgi:hypothetical protein
MKTVTHIATGPFSYIEFHGKETDLQKMKMLYNELAEVPKKWSQGVFEEIETFTGEKVLYNAEKHEYRDLDGNVLLSGSQYAKNLTPVFQKEIISIKEAKRLGVKKEDIQNFWQEKGTLSADFGTTIHKLFELWFRYRKTAFWSDPKHIVLLDILNSFPLKDDARIAHPEAIISSVKEQKVGTTDLLLESEDKSIEIIDYKIIPTSALKNDYTKYIHQINFYRHILESSGRVVSGMKLCVYSGKWEIIDVDRLEILK